MENISHHTAEPSTAALLGGIVNDVKNLLVQEVALTKLEVRDELRKAKTDALALGIGIGIVAAGVMLLMLMLVQVLAVFTQLPLWGCYGLVGSGLVVLGAVWLAVGQRPAEAFTRAAQPTVKTRKENGQWHAEPTTSAKR
jgi:hypothetical protein